MTTICSKCKKIIKQDNNIYYSHGTCNECLKPQLKQYIKNDPVSKYSMQIYLKRKENKKLFQKERIMKLFIDHEYVSLNQIIDLRIGKYSTRIDELRKEGILISKPIQKWVDGQMRSLYWIASESERPSEDIILEKIGK